ncbi:TPM domain-containing protein [Candidatus Phycosocius spiralis]|uniref:TPM domain-containing protein n=1 Tax=Candidatus Phycosocius spiralis TaxID=2815099 RepID=A0ABQ4PTM4_9PROT|nr:TPM domain-containing protein [Candidatus Phycosocius spiralis]GIU66078.1 hypothetical protein PsB1_0232 [Candidatus Phycosocius spiralis]
MLKIWQHRVRQFTLIGCFAVAVLAAIVSSTQTWAAGPTFPALTGRVVDAANIIPDDTEAQLTAQLAALEAKSSDQLVVATVPSLQGFEIEEYGYQLGRTWQIGQGEGLSNGIILLVAPNERKVRIEVGYGLEGVMTDFFAGQIIRDTIVPAFKAGDMPLGITKGVTAIEGVLTADPAELQARAVRGLKEQASGMQYSPAQAIIMVLVLLLWVWISVHSSRHGRFRRRSAWGMTPFVLYDWDQRRRGGGGFGGFGGGGGFSGGGGSFGGGGSSGSW